MPINRSLRLSITWRIYSKTETGWCEKYRRSLRGDRRTDREKAELREELIVATRSVQRACAELIVDRMNELAFSFRENKIKIDRLRRVLEIVRQPVRRHSQKRDH